MDSKLSAAFEVSQAIGSGTVHDEAGGRSAQEERGAMLAHADRRAFWWAESTRNEI